MNLKKTERRNFIKNLAYGGIGVGLLGAPSFSIGKSLPIKDLKIGIVGLSVHSAAFSKILNDKNKKSDLAGCTIAALYHPPGNPDVDFTPVQLDQFKKDVVEMGVVIVKSMDQLLDTVDVVMIETNDGRPHLEEALPSFKAGKPVFIDKPVAATLKGVVEIYNMAQQYKIPVFTSSGLRYLETAQNINQSQVLSASTFSPATLEKSHTELFWYGIHGVELLYAVMGAGCKEVMHAHHTESEDLVIGYWNDDRVGVFRGIREGKRDFGGTVFAEKDIIPLGSFTGYRPLVVKIVEFFLTGKPPVPIAETIEVYAFMEAAQESKARGGLKVSLEEVLKNAY